MSVHHSSLKHISVCRRSSHVSSYHKPAIICFVIIQILRENGSTVGSYGCISCRKRIVQQSIILNYKLFTYYLLLKIQIFIRHALTLTACISIHFCIFIFIKFGWGLLYWEVIPLAAQSVTSRRQDGVDYRRENVFCESFIKLSVLLLSSASSE